MKARIAREEAEQKYQKAQERTLRNNERKERARRQSADRAPIEALPSDGIGGDASMDTGAAQ